MIEDLSSWPLCHDWYEMTEDLSSKVDRNNAPPGLIATKSICGCYCCCKHSYCSKGTQNYLFEKIGGVSCSSKLREDMISTIFVEGWIYKHDGD